MYDTKFNRRVRRLVSFLITVTVSVVICGGVYWLITDPKSPLPDAWNPISQLDVSEPYTMWTDLKLSRATKDSGLCLAVLEDADVSISPMEDLIVSDQCGIEGRVTMRSVGSARVTPVETRCAVALRMAMWERHGIQVAAQAYLDQPVARIHHFSSYNCRAMRTGTGATTRMSTHATADAIDVSGFTLADGQIIDLRRDWEGSDSEALFLKAVRDSACDWFVTTLSPDYNALHADHFHLQNKGWGTCR
jgi:hypothetical protein